MKNTEISTNRICPKITGTNINFVTARAAPKITEIPENKAIMHMLVIINRSFAELDKLPTGQTSTERTRYLESMARMAVNDIVLYFPQVTIKEIDEAVNRGIRQSYGPYYNFNVVAIHTFVEKYLASEERLNTLDQQKRYLADNEEPVELSLAERWQIMQNGVMVCYNTYRKSGRILDFGSVNYLLFEKAGQIALSLEEKKAIYEQALAEISHEKQSQASNNMRAWLEWKNNGSLEAEAKSRAREIALRNYFNTKPDLSLIMDQLYKAYADYS